MVVTGVHRQVMAGIDSMQITSKKSQQNFPVCVSIVQSGGYEDDDEGANIDEFWYTGAGGNDLLGSKQQVSNQQKKGGNLALCNSKEEGNHIRVFRKNSEISPAMKSLGLSCKGQFVYLGLYTCIQGKFVEGKKGCSVWKFQMRRVGKQMGVECEEVLFSGSKKTLEPKDYVRIRRQTHGRTVGQASADASSGEDDEMEEETDSDATETDTENEGYGSDETVVCDKQKQKREKTAPRGLNVKINKLIGASVSTWWNKHKNGSWNRGKIIAADGYKIKVRYDDDPAGKYDEDITLPEETCVILRYPRATIGVASSEVKVEEEEEEEEEEGEEEEESVDNSHMSEDEAESSCDEGADEQAGAIPLKIDLSVWRSDKGLSGYKGVYQTPKGKYVTKIEGLINGKRVRKSLGSFSTAEEAATRYAEAHIEMHGRCKRPRIIATQATPTKAKTAEKLRATPTKERKEKRKGPEKDRKVSQELTELAKKALSDPSVLLGSENGVRRLELEFGNGNSGSAGWYEAEIQGIVDENKLKLYFPYDKQTWPDVKLKQCSAPCSNCRCGWAFKVISDLGMGIDQESKVVSGSSEQDSPQMPPTETHTDNEEGIHAECGICRDKPANHIITACGHTMCLSCITLQKKCGFCNKHINHRTGVKKIMNTSNVIWSAEPEQQDAAPHPVTCQEPPVAATHDKPTREKTPPFPVHLDQCQIVKWVNSLPGLENEGVGERLQSYKVNTVMALQELDHDLLKEMDPPIILGNRILLLAHIKAALQ